MEKTEREIEYNLRHDYVRIWSSLTNELSSGMAKLERKAMFKPNYNIEKKRNALINRIIQRNLVAIKTLGDIFRKLDLFKHYEEQ